jgi:hypothetical protein
MIRYPHTIDIQRRSFTRDPDTHRATSTVDTMDSVQANVQPAAGRDVEFLPEGERTGQEIKVYVAASVDVETTDEDSDSPADLVVFDGQTYKPVQSQHHRQRIPYRKLICKKVD